MNKSADRHIKRPQRSCVACRMTTDKQQVLRFVREKSGEVCFDNTGRLAGRGAYLCDEQGCFDKARKGHILDRALRTKLDDGDYERLADECRRYGYFGGCIDLDMQDRAALVLGEV